MAGTAAACAAAVSALGLVGCAGGSSTTTVALSGLKDGTYTGQSSTLNANVNGDGYGVVTLKVEGGKIADAQFEAFEPDGTPKDENYGKQSSYYARAQSAISAGDEYAAALVASGNPDGVDVVSGSTYLYDQFIEATNDALSQAK